LISIRIFSLFMSLPPTASKAFFPFRSECCRLPASPEQTLDDADIDSGDTLYLV